MGIDPKEAAKAAKSKVDLQPGIEQDQEQENSVQEATEIGRKRHPGPWTRLHKNVKENQKLILRHSHAGNLIGHDNKTGEVILKDPDFDAPKTAEEIQEEEMAAKGPISGIKG